MFETSFAASPLLFFWLGMAMTAAGAALVGSAASKLHAKQIRVRPEKRR